VDENHLLRVTEEGPLSITAALSDHPQINATVSTTVRLNQTYDGKDIKSDWAPVLYPNPTSGDFRVKGCDRASLSLYDASGKELMRVEEYQEGSVLDISSVPKGIYPIRIVNNDSFFWLKLVKE
jgi:hypothetical protein